MKKKEGFSLDSLIVILASVLLILLVINFAMIGSMNKNLKEIKESTRPSDIELTIIDSGCAECGLVSFKEMLSETYNVNILTETIIKKEDATSLIKKYNIQKLPAYILTGEIDRDEKLLDEFKENGDALVLENDILPYFDVKSEKVFGRVSMTLINANSCSECLDVEPLIDSFEGSGMYFTGKNIYDYKALNGFVDKYKITKLPAIILSSEASHYQFLDDVMQQLNGEITSDGKYLFQNLGAPYYDLTESVETKRTKGLIILINLIDENCDECYDISEHKKILQAFGLKIVSERTVDVNSPEGQSLVNKYDITTVPTVILNKEFTAYPSKDVIINVGSVESDGSFVFREQEVMGAPYKDLETGKVLG